jgi:predicted CXXCH cytochrome family protein
MWTVDHKKREKRGTMNCEMPSWFNPLILGWSLFVLFVLVSCNPPRVTRDQDQTAFVKPPLLHSEAEVDLSSKCFDCHQYRENHHPIDVAPSNPENFPFPLYDGMIKCLTCHHEDHAGGSANLLRGGPYAELREICFQCHSEDKYAEIDPHIMLDENGMVLDIDGKPVCLLCHAVKPNPAKDRTGDVRFRADIAFLCWRCHDPMANSRFFEQHFLKKPPIPMIRFIERKEQELKVTIPLVPRERITCSTCHNPHQKGVISYGPSAKGADEPGKLRVPSPAICIVCHDL